MQQDERPVLRIGEVSRRTGVSVSTLRAWERRYGLLDPTRTEGGHRLYGEADIHRVRRMRRLTQDGWSAAAAAREAGRPDTEPTTEPDDVTISALGSRLERALDDFDAPKVDLLLDEAFGRLSLGAALDQVVMPALRWVGAGWQEDARVIAREHVATNAIRPRLLRLLRISPDAPGRACVAATPEGESHDLGLLAAATMAATDGWRVHFLGAQTPRDALARAVDELRPSVVLVAALSPVVAAGFVAEPWDLGRACVIAGGAGFAELDDPDDDHLIIHRGGMQDFPQVLLDAAGGAGD